jgi:hypothetical protein
LQQIFEKQIVPSPERISRTKSGPFRRGLRKPQCWLELLIDSSRARAENAQELLKESAELLAIFASIGEKLKE